MEGGVKDKVVQGVDRVKNWNLKRCNKCVGNFERKLRYYLVWNAPISII